MRAYLSYSLLDKEEFIITLLSNELRAKGFTVAAGGVYFGHSIEFTTLHMIRSSQLFIGIITLNSPLWERVLNEWSISKESNVPNILLIEDGVSVDPNFNDHYIRFNRHNPHPSIEEIKQRMLSPKVQAEDWGWLIGGAALIALIALLSGKK